ncbi:MAG: hypothetical protein ACO29X_01110 [Arcobacteraceae bacterium]|jgi:hypothetical protein
MSSKKFIYSIYILTFIFIACVAVFNFIIDPFQQYRQPTLYKTFYGGNQRALNTGLSKHHDYQSIIIGSSMTENFLISKSNEIIPKPIKLSISGATSHEIFLMLNTAFGTGKKIDTILIGFDMYSLSGKVDRLSYGDNSLPMYLYDNDILNDFFYLANFDTLKESIQTPLLNQQYNTDEPRWKYENMYQWQHLSEDSFGKENVLEMYDDYKKSKKIIPLEYTFDNLKNSFEHNFISLVEKHPETKFIFFYPPYSMLAFKQWEEHKTLHNILKFKSYAFKRFSAFKNVRLYDFHNAFEITKDLDNYKDFSHYHQNINSWIIDQIKENNYLITIANGDKKIEELQKEIISYKPPIPEEN